MDDTLAIILISVPSVLDIVLIFVIIYLCCHDFHICPKQQELFCSFYSEGEINLPPPMNPDLMPQDGFHDSDFPSVTNDCIVVNDN